MNMHGIPRYTLVWGARYTLGVRYLSKNTVFKFISYMMEVTSNYMFRPLRCAVYRGIH